ncbi:Dipeptide transport system permease protein DppB [Streptomyces sp. RB5]|uniref:Dipeptide transport system permease protein DppB n=1 Tax=Streptomyces smaragdinus TaxID=2585196 RepID=A0A7K0CB81_9ACTN|nr:ABC transporter permease [Streptomyces smaragdinus]MQY10717.1 Dipeptide transport system permease protein DppB [Streptomyces smaragdinus]
MRFLLRRLGFFVLTLWAALTLNFFVPRFMPGDPVAALTARTRGRVSRDALEQMLTSFGYKPDQNLFVQYVEYLGNMFTGDWGRSIGGQLGEPVTGLIGQALPWTLGLVGITTVLAFALGTMIGTVAGWRRGGWLDSLLPPVFVVTSALPVFWVALMLIFAFSMNAGSVLPGTFNYDNSIVPGFSPGFVGSVLQHAVLPAATLLITLIGGWILTMRNNMITTLAEDYVRMGRAKGLSPRRVMYGYAARNAVLPNLTGFAMSLGFVVSGAVLIEFVFSYNGVGYLFYNSVQNVDYPLMQALFMLFTVAVLAALLIVDIATVWLDPRARSADAGGR